MFIFCHMCVCSFRVQGAYTMVVLSVIVQLILFQVPCCSFMNKPQQMVAQATIMLQIAKNFQAGAYLDYFDVTKSW